jgi:methyl-accepting chemotaxis protein
MFKNLSIGTRIRGGSAVTLFTMVVLAAVGMLQVNKINRALTVINDVNGVKARQRAAECGQRAPVRQNRLIVC